MSGPVKRNTPSIALSEELIRAMDEAAADRKWSRAQLVREIATTWLVANGYLKAAQKAS